VEVPELLLDLVVGRHEFCELGEHLANVGSALVVVIVDDKRTSGSELFDYDVLVDEFSSTLDFDEIERCHVQDEFVLLQQRLAFCEEVEQRLCRHDEDWLVFPHVFTQVAKTVGNMKALFAQKALYSSSRILPPGSLPLPFPPVAEPLGGRYVNVNSRNELNFANHLLRERSFEDRKTSLIYVCEGRDEAEALGIRPFVDRQEIAEVIVVAGRTTPSLDRIAEEAKVRLIIPEKPSPALGEMLRLGMDSATGDILVTTISDDTFSPADIAKLLVYLQDADLVTGTRTTRQMIEQGANMRGIVRLAHLALAKLLELFWWRLEPRFTDICCVYRGMWANTYRLIRDQLESPGVEIFPEMIIEVLRARKRVIEVPVNYFSRDLIHPHVRSRYQTPGTFLRVLRLMVRKRFDETRRLSAGRFQEGKPPT
jgi:hypothetical protein